MSKSKKNIYKDIINKGRKLIVTKGSSELTARKLAKETGYSVGTIYNNFDNLDNYITIQNMQTLEELYDILNKNKQSKNNFEKINCFLDTYITFIENNKNLWELLFNFHNKLDRKIKFSYKKRIYNIYNILAEDICTLLKNKSSKSLRKTSFIIATSIFTNSSFLLQNNKIDDLNKNNKYLLNTYLAGLIAIKK